VISFESGSGDGANSCLNDFEFVEVGHIYIYIYLIVDIVEGLKLAHQ